jgi:phosphomannomutase
VTASHNSGAYVGMKFVERNVELMPTDVLKELFQREYFPQEYGQKFPLFTGGNSTLVAEKVKRLMDFL